MSSLSLPETPATLAESSWIPDESGIEPSKDHNMYRERKRELLHYYIEREALAFGSFTLASGKTSDIYIDSRTVTTYPKALCLIARMFKQIIEENGLLVGEANLVVPVGVSGVPIGTALAIDLDVPFIIDRLEQKGYGLGKRFEGRWSGSRNCLVVDDLVTAGGTILKTVNGLRDEGFSVENAVVVVDREEGGREDLAKAGVRLFALLTKSELRQALRENQSHA